MGVTGANDVKNRGRIQRLANIVAQVSTQKKRARWTQEKNPGSGRNVGRRASVLSDVGAALCRDCEGGAALESRHKAAPESEARPAHKKSGPVTARFEIGWREIRLRRGDYFFFTFSPPSSPMETWTVCSAGSNSAWISTTLEKKWVGDSAKSSALPALLFKIKLPPLRVNSHRP